MTTSEIAVSALSMEPILAARVDTILDWVFVTLSAVMLYMFAVRSSAYLHKTRSVLSAIVESIGDGVLIMGPDRTIAHANAAALHMLACRSESELVGMGAQDFSRRYVVMSSPTGAVVKPDSFGSQQAFEHEGAFRARLVLHPLPETEVVVDTTASGVRSLPRGQASLVVSVFHDVSDAEQLESMRDRFFASTAHTLKTPVAIIKANVQCAARTAPPALRPSMLAVERQCNRIDRLVKNLQVVARARSRSLVVHLRHVALAPIVLDAIRELQAATSTHELRTEIDDVPSVYADHERIAVVVRNLGYAAMRASRPRSTLTIYLVRREPLEIELGVRYDPLPVSAHPFAHRDEYDDTALSECANATIIEAHGGEVGQSDLESVESSWVRLPILEERNGEHPDRR